MDIDDDLYTHREILTDKDDEDEDEEDEDEEFDLSGLSVSIA